MSNNDEIHKLIQHATDQLLMSTKKVLELQSAYENERAENEELRHELLELRENFMILMDKYEGLQQQTYSVRS